MGWKDNWKTGTENPPPEKVYTPIPDGEYLLKIEEAILDESKDPARVKFKFEIWDEGEFNGRFIWQTQQLSEKGCYYLWQNLNKIGVEVKDPSDLEAKLVLVTGSFIEAHVKQSQGKDPAKPFYNVYFSETALPPNLNSKTDLSF